MGHRIEILFKDGIDTSSMGIISAPPIKVYNIDDCLNSEELALAQELLADSVANFVTADCPVLNQIFPWGQIPDEGEVIEISPKPGVNDPEGEEVRKSLERSLGREVGGVSFAQQYVYTGKKLTPEEQSYLIKGLGINPLIKEIRTIGFSSWEPNKGMGFHFPEVNLPEVEPFTYTLTPSNISLDSTTRDKDLVQISEERMLELNLQEMQTIRNLFSQTGFLERRAASGLQEKLTDAEAELLAQSWSEHCLHKKFNALWRYSSDDPNDRAGIPSVTDSVFKSIICGATLRIGENIGWLVSVFEDNSGVIELNPSWNIAHKVETHNFPSALDPFGGANTGTGGVFRDPKSTGRGMTIVSSQYGFRTPHPNSYRDLPPEILPPSSILSGVVLGVEDYGNKVGIPTMSGQVMIDSGWLKPAIYVGAVAVAPAEINGNPTHEKEIGPGYIALSLGGKVGKDGIHGATASSTDLSADAEQSEQINQAVQIGDPIVEKCVFEAMDLLQLQGLIEASQDCGAGGWNSAVGELATISGGVEMDLSGVPEKYAGLTGWEKLVSEAQEREVIVIRPENLERVIEICKHNNVEATPIATFNDSGYYHVKDQDQTIAFLPMDFLHKGLPQWEIRAHWTPSQNTEPDIPSLEILTEEALNLIGRPNIQNYHWISTRFDHEVRGGSRIKPIVGIGRGKSDAIAYQPILTEEEIVIETWGSNPWQGDIDAYEMGKNNIVDAIGRVIAAGGFFSQGNNNYRIAFNGNTTCPKPEEDPVVAAKVIRMLKGAADAEIVFNSPTISGKDSTSLQRSFVSTETGEEIKVKAKPEMLMNALAIVPDDSTLTTPDVKIPGDIIYVIGDTRDELGASEFYLMNETVGRNVPVSDLEEIRTRYGAVHTTIERGLLHSAQYASKGGLFAALANASIAGDLGINVSLDSLDERIGRADKILFSETTGRFIVTVPESKREEFESTLQGQYFRAIGEVTQDPQFRVTYHNTPVIETDVCTLREKNKGEIIF